MIVFTHTAGLYSHTQQGQVDWCHWTAVHTHPHIVLTDIDTPTHIHELCALLAGSTPAHCLMCHKSLAGNVHVCACHSDESFESFDSYVSYVSQVSYVYVCLCGIRKQDSSLSRYLFKIKDDKTHQKHNINKKHKKHKNHGLFLRIPSLGFTGHRLCCRPLQL